MKKLLSFTLVALGLLLTTHPAHAGWYKGNPKEVFVSSNTTGPFLVTPAVSTNSVGAAAYNSGAVYQVILSTGASGEFEVMFDTNTCMGITSSMFGSTSTVNANSQLGPRLVYSSTTQNTVITFDPPVRFDNGLCIIDSASTGQASVTYELGRGISGQ